jgi:hypothetical protein
MLKYQLDDVCASELETRDSETLPDRAAMSLVNANLAIAVNLAPASSCPSCGKSGVRRVLSHRAIAAANAQQATPISLVVCRGRRRGPGKASRDRAASART